MSQASPCEPAADRADQPARRPRTTNVGPRRRSQASTSSSDSCSAGISSEAVVGQRLLHPAGALQGEQLPGVAAAARARSPTPSAATARVQQVRPPLAPYAARACSCRQAAIAAWSPDSSTGGHVEAAPGRRPGVDGVLQQPVLVRLLDQRLGVAHEPGQQPDHGLGDRQRGHLSAVEDVVAERDLDAPRRGSRRGRAPAGRCPRSGRRRTPAASRAGQLAGERLGERRPGRRRHDQRRAVERRARRTPRPTARASSPCPAPPPYGVSSTVRCRSWVHCRRSWTCTLDQALARAPCRSATAAAARGSRGRS